ncbi:hypothetical protein ACFYPN_31730 [Streptomyces sp. NPDC005576]
MCGQYPDHTDSIDLLLAQHTVLHGGLVQSAYQRFDVGVEPGDLFRIRGP